MKKIFLSFLAAVLAMGLYVQTTVKGYVFEEMNGNGRRDRNEKGLAGVAVSNSVDVTVTDARGYYKLPVGDDNIIFVVKPPGYRTPLDHNGLPRFYYATTSHREEEALSATY